VTTLSSLRALPHSLSMASAVLLIGFATSLTAPFIPLFGSQVAHMTPLSLGLFQSLLAVSSILVSFQLGRLSDRLNSRKPLVLLAAGSAALGYLLFTTTTHYLALTLIAAVFLSTGAAAFPQLFAFARSRLGGVTPQVAEHGLTTLRSVFSLAWVVGPGLGAGVVAAAGFRGLFLVTALLYALAGVVVLRSGQGESRRAAAPPVQMPVPAPGPRPAMNLIVSSFVLYGASMSMGFIALPLFMTRELHLPNSDVGLLVGLCALLEIPIMMSFVFLPRRFSNQTLILFGFGLFTTYFLTVGLSHSLAPLLAAQLIRAIVIAISASLGMAYFQELLPGRLGQATTLFVNTNSAGSMVAGLVSGAFAQTFSYRAVFLLCAALTLAACGLMLLVRRRQNVKTSGSI
jgi:MFS transporter, SET family, sugar efflux transporter